MVVMVELRTGGDGYPATVLHDLPQPRYYRFHPITMQDGDEERRGFAPERARIPLHDREVGSNEWGEIYLVHDQELRASDAWTTLARHLVPASYVYDIDRGVHQLRAKRGRQVVSAALDED